MACFSLEQYKRLQKVQPVNRKKRIGPNFKLLKSNLEIQLTKEIIPIATSTRSA